MSAPSREELGSVGSGALADEASEDLPADELTRLLHSFDMFDEVHEQRKWQVLEHARLTCPVARTEVDGGFWLITRYDDVRRVLEDPETFSSAQVTPQPSPIRLNPLDSDPPVQPDLRRILNPLFSRSALERYVPDMRQSADRLIDGWIDDGEFDLIRDFAGPFVAGALTAIVFPDLGSDDMVAAVDIVNRAGSAPTEAELIVALTELAMLAAQALAAAEENLPDEPSVLRAIVTGTVEDGRPLTDDERLGVLIVLFLGGLDTTRGAIGAIAHELALQPELESRLRDPRWSRRDLDEFVRHASPVGCLARTATRDTEVGGVSMRAGDRLLIRFDSANRDDTRFADADELVFDPPRPGHVGFGLGIHRCLGAHLARIQITVAFERLLARITNLRMASDGIQWHPGISNGPRGLPVLFDKLIDAAGDSDPGEVPS
jgi:cytochrome P450